MNVPEQLEELERRIEVLSLHPHLVKAPLARLVRPVLGWWGWQPDAVIVDARALLAGASSKDAAAIQPLLRAAVDELEINVRRVERATVMKRRVLVSHAAWLRRMLEAIRAVHLRTQDTDDPVARRLACELDPTMILPPLTLRPGETLDSGEDEDGQTNTDAAHLLELQLSAVDHLMATARDEPALHGRRRRLLEAARQVLLDTNASVPLDGDGVNARLRDIGSRISRINRQESEGIAGDQGLLHQVRTALSRGEREKLYAALQAMDDHAVASGDAQVLRCTHGALQALRADVGAVDPVEKTAPKVLGDAIPRAVAAAYQLARDRAADRRRNPKATPQERFLLNVVESYLAPGAERSTLSAALAVDGCFDVGGALSPLRVIEYETRVRAVGHPTQQMVLTPARDISDLPNAIIEDPRMVLLSLATGRLLARRFIQTEKRPRERTVMRGELRVYVLDGSESMIGPRARMRDALMVAELATLIRRLNEPTRTSRVALYYRYFDKELGKITRVDSTDGALLAVSDVLANIRGGGTDIEKALLASFATVVEARAQDPDLAKAQIVLVTDGEAAVDASKVLAAQRQLTGLEIGVSVVALGEENLALKALVTRQRMDGMRAFYHFLPDAELARIAEGRIHDGPPISLPSRPADAHRSPNDLAAELQETVGDMVDELERLQRMRDEEALKARRRVRADDDDLTGEGAQARLDALHKDARSLQRRFQRWFPQPAVQPNPTMPEAGTLERQDLEAIRLMLTTIAEVIEVVDGPPLVRQADAMDMLERMLPDARVSPGRYLAVLRGFAPALASELNVLHHVVGGGYRFNAPVARRKARA